MNECFSNIPPTTHRYERCVIFVCYCCYYFICLVYIIGALVYYGHNVCSVFFVFIKARTDSQTDRHTYKHVYKCMFVCTFVQVFVCAQDTIYNTQNNQTNHSILLFCTKKKKIIKKKKTGFYFFSLFVYVSCY